MLGRFWPLAVCKVRQHLSQFHGILPNDHRVVHQHFVEGLHVARRSDRAWVGLSTDLMLEQVLNAQHEIKWRSDKRQRNDRTAASHVVTCYAGMRDMKDTHTLLLTMSEINPFAESTFLRNIMRESMPLVTLMCAARKKSDRRVGTR